jgi:hypothetical protein
MKLNLKTEAGSRKPEAGSQKSDFRPPTSGLRSPSSERGIALVITLILLSVTLVMAIAFLAISRRERGSVTTSTDTATARLAADSALASAEAQIVANVLSTTNPYNFGLLVSTNYINTNGFVATGGADPTNVSYNYGSGVPLNNLNDLKQNLANLFYSPRPPVFVVTNQQTGASEFRFYLDLNRNGQFDANGLVPNVEWDSVSGSVVTNGTTTEVGDPEWIGVLERPDTSHGPNNKFLSRYAFIALPVGNSLDLNYIHNQAMTRALNNANDGYFRNQGAGSWEINLAAFLADLNTNQWDPPTFFNPVNDPYNYQQWMQPNEPNTGRGFEDALALLNYRYAGNYNSLASANGLYPAGIAAFQNNIDLYSDLTPPMATPAGISAGGQIVAFSWAGADNTNHFFTTQELFNSNETSAKFVNSLLAAGNTNLTYDRYTFYHLLAQLGTDSSPESGKLNLNYANVDASGNVVPGAETNFAAWTPVQFFTNAADRMLRAYTAQWATNYDVNNNPVLNTNFVATFNVTNGFGIANIPVLVSNQFVYSPAVQRILQLAANIYDATANRAALFGEDFPSVFRPTFNVVLENGFTDVYICGFSEVTSATEPDAPLSRAFDLGNQAVLASLAPGIHTINISGVPMILGAKKGFPNFNKFAMQDEFLITRKLRINRHSTNDLPKTYTVDQQFTCGITIELAVECWNSYASNYTRAIDIYATNFLTMTLTNNDGNGYTTNATMIVSGFTNITSASGGWPGYDTASPTISFQLPLDNTNLAFLPDGIYDHNGGNPFFYSTNIASPPWEITWPALPQPHWWLIVTNNVQVVMVDHTTQRLIDYVQLHGPNGSRDITSEILSFTDPSSGYSAMWFTNPIASSFPPNLPSGVWNQIQTEAQSDPKNLTEEYGLRNFYYVNGSSYLGGLPHNPNQAFGSTNLNIQTETVTAVVVSNTTWQANDPLVHYLAADLTVTPLPLKSRQQFTPFIPPDVNDRYQPWGRSVQMASAVSVNPETSAFNLALKDPLVRSSDDWNFPTNKFPTVGWLGRVHRGTPWQTVYLKASGIDTNYWENWTGNLNGFDATNTSPKEDRLLFDLFTTAPDDNATHGQLSVNQDHLAAWSAIFSGIVVPTNLVGNYTIINRAGGNGTNSLLWQLANSINQTRAIFTNAASTGGAFKHVGDILATPQLTEQSPFLPFIDPTTGTNDELMEWLPQQTMSLLDCPSAPSYVIYSYGQTLTPAPGSVINGGGSFFGMITNYQVVSEVATRTFVVVEGVTSADGTPLPPSQWHPHIVIKSFNVLPPD